MEPLRVTLLLPPELLDAIRAEARAEARAALEEERARSPRERPEPRAVAAVRFMRVGAYAERVGLGRRKLHELIAAGLPTVGEGRMRRVDVAAADVWIEAHALQRS